MERGTRRRSGGRTQERSGQGGGAAKPRRRHRTAGRALLLTGAWLATLGCGSDPAPEEAAAPLAPLAVQEHGIAGGGAPVIRSVRIDPMQPVPGGSVRAVVSAHDPDGDAVELRYRWRVDGVERGEGVALDLGDVGMGASIELEVVASDGSSRSDAQTASVRVVNRAPVVEGLGIEPPDRVYPGDKVVVTPVGRDPDGGPVDFRFEWLVNGEVVEGEGRSFATTGLQQGDRVRVRVFATDGRDESRPLESADITVGSAHPEIVSTPPGMSADGVFRYRVEASDPDGDRTLRFRLDEAPEGMKLDAVLGEIEWRPGPEQTGVHPVKVVVIDSSKLETSQGFQITVSRTEEPAPPPAAGADGPDATAE